MSASAPQIRAIHSLRAAAGLTADDDYRAFLEQAAGVRSSKELSSSAAITVIDRLKVLSGQPRTAAKPRSKARGALDLSGTYAAIARALWISGWNLGVVQNRTDVALVAFVSRQTGIDHLNWMRDYTDGRKVVEALKSWLAREAGVQWPRQAMIEGRDMRKWAVVKAQLHILGDRRRLAGDANLDQLMTELGVLVRRAR